MPEYLVKQYISQFNGTSDEDKANPRQCTVKDLSVLKDIEWIKPYTLTVEFSRLSASPYFNNKENGEEFYLIAEDRDIKNRKIIAIIVCSKEEALKAFPEYVIPEDPYRGKTFDSGDWEVKALKNKQDNYFDKVPVYLDHVLNGN